MDSLCLQSEAKHASDLAIWMPLGQSVFASMAKFFWNAEKLADDIFWTKILAG